MKNGMLNWVQVGWPLGHSIARPNAPRPAQRSCWFLPFCFRLSGEIALHGGSCLLPPGPDLVAMEAAKVALPVVSTPAFLLLILNLQLLFQPQGLKDVL